MACSSISPLFSISNNKSKKANFSLDMVNSALISFLRSAITYNNMNKVKHRLNKYNYK